ncbi:LamG domain-containing protein [Thermoproteota archaeon]
MTLLIIMPRNHSFSVFTVLMLSTLLIGSSIVSMSEAASICPNGAASYWALNEQSGTTAKDSWDGNDGTVMNGESWVPGKVNNGHEFRNELTLLAWFKADDFDVDDGRIISRADGLAENDHIWMLSPRDPSDVVGSDIRMRFRLELDGDTQTLIDNSGEYGALTDTEATVVNLAADTWYFAVAVYDGIAMKIYLDGDLIASADVSGVIATDPLDETWIGGNPSSPTDRPFDGMIDEVAIFNRAITPTEINNFYNAGTGQEICNAVCPNGLISYWRFDETSGFTTADSADGNDGIVQNGANFEAGKINNGMRFDGVDGYVNVGQFNVVNNYIDLGTFDVSGTGITILAWFKADDFDVNDARIISKSKSVATNDIWWMLSTRGISDTPPIYMRFRVKLSGSTQTLVDSDAGGAEGLADTIGNDVQLVAGTWYFAAAVYDGTDMKIYLDGDLIASASTSGTVSIDNTVSVWMGDNPPDVGDRPFDGIIDEVAIFDRGLSQSEITALYNSGSGTGICVVGEATDSAGVSQSVFAAGGDIYATGSGFPPNTLITLYVVPAQTWTDGMPIPPDISGDGVNTVQTDAQGNLGPTLVWPNAQIGQYDLVFDNSNGQYDEGTDIVVGLTGTGFTVGSGSIIGGVHITTNKVGIMAPYLLTVLGLLSLAVIAISIRKRKH